MIDVGPPWMHYLVVAAVFLVATGIIWSKAVKPIVVAVNRIADQVDRLKVLADNAAVLTELPRRLTKLEHAVTELKEPIVRVDKRTETLEPNGGLSVHDRIVRIDDNTDKGKT